MGISVVLLAYKEEENLRVLLPQIKDQVKQTGEEFEILVIDTEKPLDNTKGVCEEFGAKYVNQEEPAFAGAFKTGIQYASMDKFLILDSDGSHNPKYIPAIYDKFTKENCDVVIGSRYVEGGKTNDAKSSIVMSHILNGMFRFFLGIKAKDISTDYRMYYTEQLKNVSLSCHNSGDIFPVQRPVHIKSPTCRHPRTCETFLCSLFRTRLSRVSVQNAHENTSRPLPVKSNGSLADFYSFLK